MTNEEKMTAIQQLRAQAMINVRMARETIELCEGISRKCNGNQVSANTAATVQKLRREVLTMLKNTKAHCRALAES